MYELISNTFPNYKVLDGSKTKPNLIPTMLQKLCYNNPEYIIIIRKNILTNYLI